MRTLAQIVWHEILTENQTNHEEPAPSYAGEFFVRTTI